MKTLLILGGGTAGTMMANKLVDQLDRQWQVVVVDPERDHIYQPGLLFLPFGAIREEKMVRERKQTFRKNVIWKRTAIRQMDPKTKQVEFEDGSTHPYDVAIIATGTRIRPDMTPGLEAGPAAGIHDFYTLTGAKALQQALKGFNHGRLVLNVVEMPIKCPVAPLEFLFLADDYFKRRGIREQVELVYATPLDAAFTKPYAAKKLGYLLEEKGIHLETEYMTCEVDTANQRMVSYDERQVGFDLLVSVPTHSGAAFIADSGLGNELDFVQTDRHSLKASDLEDVFVLGDATDLPASKAGSVAHFQAEILTENVLAHINGQALPAAFDGHANCFVETGAGKAMLIDFNYEIEPLPGHFPLAKLGPFRLMHESRINHWGKLAFRPIYWHALLPGRHIPLSPHMQISGKQIIAS